MKIGDLCNFSSGHGFTPKDWRTSGLPIIRIQNLNGSQSYNYYQGTPDPIWIITSGDLLFAWAGSKGVSFGPTIWSGPRGVLNQHIFRVRPNEGVDSKWLYYALSVVTSEIEKKAHGFKVGLVHVHKSDITNAKVVCPFFDEQCRIASVISMWDDAVEKTERLILAKEKQKKFVMQALMTGKRRLKSFRKTWSEFHLGDLFNERTDRASEHLPLLSITREEGVIPRNEVNRKDTSSEDKSKYLRICPGDIGYNTMRMWQGVSALSFLDGIISPAYTVCTPIKGVDGAFISYLFKLPRTINIFYRFSQGLTSDTWNLKFHHFEEIKLSIPDLDEQKAIVKILKACDEETTLLRKQLSALQKQKRGLTQKLLTGQWRVKVNEEV